MAQQPISPAHHCIRISKRLIIFVLCIIASLPSVGQFRDDFSHADTSHIVWHGDWERFAVNRHGQLQSQSSTAAESALWHESTASIEAEWSGWARISGTCSAHNLIRCYLTLNGDSLQADAYYVQIGGANKNIVLYEQHDGTATKVIENEARKKILNTAAAVVRWRVTRGADGIFHLYSHVEGVDSAFVEEGIYFANRVRSKYFALYVKNSKQRGYDFYFDDIAVAGSPQDMPVRAEEDDDTPNTSSQSAVYLLTESISPNGDGYEDEACISYSLPDDGYYATLSVYTPTGVLVRHVCEKQSLPTAGTLCWNGTNAHNTPVDIGVYVLAIELKNATTKDVLRRKFAVAVTR